ncbi:hypothetical protein V8D89_005272 [Ganoderma adspersum]
MAVELTGIQNAHMPWTEARFLDHMFKNLSSMRGGCQLLREIGDALVSGTLRIIKLTDEQLTEATANPERFLTNPTLRSQPVKPRRREAYHVIPLVLNLLILHPLVLHPLVLHPLVLHPLVLHPLDLSPVSHPHSSELPSKVEVQPVPEPSLSSVASLLIRIVPGPESVPRRQRRDIKKCRRRPVTNPGGVGGVQTPEYVYDPVSGSSQPDIDIDEPKSIVSGSALSDDYVECFTEPETQSEVESEIKNATESWAAGMRSEIEDFTSDEE